MPLLCKYVPLSSVYFAFSVSFESIFTFCTHSFPCSFVLITLFTLSCCLYSTVYPYILELSVSLPQFSLSLRHCYLILKKAESDSLATALASIVFPLPGGPNSSKPLRRRGNFQSINLTSFYELLVLPLPGGPNSSKPLRRRGNYQSINTEAHYVRRSFYSSK